MMDAAEVWRRCSSHDQFCFATYVLNVAAWEERDTYAFVSFDVLEDALPFFEDCHTWDEISQHVSRRDCWIVLHGKVYDVTRFLPDHPGGDHIILAFGGKDATKVFDDIGHSQTAVEMTSQYQLKGLVEQQRSTAPIQEEQKVKKCLIC